MEITCKKRKIIHPVNTASKSFDLSRVVVIGNTVRCLLQGNLAAADFDTVLNKLSDTYPDIEVVTADVVIEYGAVSPGRKVLKVKGSPYVIDPFGDAQFCTSFDTMSCSAVPWIYVYVATARGANVYASLNHMPIVLRPNELNARFSTDDWAILELQKDFRYRDLRGVVITS